LRTCFVINCVLLHGEKFEVANHSFTPCIESKERIDPTPPLQAPVVPSDNFVVDSRSWKAVPVIGHILPTDSFIVDSRSWKAVPFSGHILPTDSFVVDSRS
jgi:hypothetical protein